RVSVFEAHAAAPRHARSDAAVAGVEDHRELGFGHYFVERIGGFVVGEKLHQRRMQLESANAAGRDQPAGFLYGFRAAHGIDTRKGHRDVAVLGGEGGDFIVGDLRTTGEALVNGEDYASNFARAIIFGQFLAAVADACVAEIFTRGFFGGVSGGIGFDVDVRVDSDEVVEVHVMFLARGNCGV